MSPLVGSVLVYDADCGFCTRSARWLARGRQWSAEPWQSIEDLSDVGLTQSLVTGAAYWMVDGVPESRGARAIARALKTHRGWRYVLGWIIDVAPVRPVARGVYFLVARNRHAMPGGTDACRLPPSPRAP